MKSPRTAKILAALVAIVGIACFWHLRLWEHLTLEQVKAKRDFWMAYYALHPVRTVLVYTAIYVLISVFGFFPGAIVLALAAGTLFGFWLGFIVVSLSSDIGGTITFLLARYLFRDWVQKNWGQKLSGINKEVKRDGVLYLLILRLTPVFPFSLVNIAMGLTPMGLIPFFLVSEFGMWPGTAAYVNAGRELGKINSVHDILSPAALTSFAVLGALPLVSKKIAGLLKEYRRAPRSR